MTLAALMLAVTLGAPPTEAAPECLAARQALRSEVPRDTELYDAAVCAEAEAQPDVARQALRALMREHPHSDLLAPAAYRLADLELGLARFAAAAEALEWVTPRFIKHPRTPDALLELAMLRQGLGQPQRAREALTTFIRLFGRKNPEGAASAAWMEIELSPEGERLASLERYVRMFGARLPPDRRVVAQAEMGRILWDRSCRHPGPDGGCIEARPAVSTPCAEHPVPQVRRGRRKARLAEQAQAHFRVALKIAKRRPEIPEYDLPRKWAYRDAVGTAMVLSHQPQFESLLAAEPFAWPRDRATARLKLRREVEGERRVLGELLKHYASVKASMSPTWVLVAAERSARMADHVGHRLLRSVPRGTPEGAPLCEAVMEEYRPLESLADGAYTYCLEKATDFQFFVPAARRCERWLNEHRPHDYPPLLELFGAPALSPMPPPTPIEAAGVIVDAQAAMDVGEALQAGERPAP